MKVAYSNINIRMEKPLKDELEGIFHEMGLTMTTAFHMFARQVVQLREIPFKITAKSEKNDSFYSEANMRVLRKSIAQAERGEFVVTKPAKEIINQLKKLAK